MLLRPARSIRAKLALLIAVSVGAAVALAFTVSSYRELSRFAEAKQAELQATAEVLAVSVADPLADGRQAAVQQALNAIGRIPQLRFAEIKDEAGRIIAEAGAGVSLVAAGETETQGGSPLWEMLDRGSVYVSAPIVKAGRAIGELGLLVDTSDLYQRVVQALLAASVSAAVAIGIGLLVASRMQRTITRPLGDLAKTMNRVRETSDFSTRAERRSDDETGQLVDAFNEMLDQIGERDAALASHREGLERTVAERTQDLAEARDVAESANRAKSDFLATMSHEIRTPMNGMLVMAELLAGTELPARQQRYAETIVRSGQTLLTIINDILDISKIEAGKLELEQGRVAIGTLVDDVLGLFWERASSKGLDLAARISADVPAVIEGDPVRLSQIMSNLINNALKFTESGHVMLTVARMAADGADCALRFSVADTGIGIPADKVDHIFEAFGQADQSTTRRFGGTGLGLSICRRLVDAMGGQISVKSVEGKGSVFAFAIPARVLEPAAPIVAGSACTALVAAEGTATRLALTDALVEAGHVVEFGEAGALEEAGIVFAAPEWIIAQADRLAASASRPHVICVAGVGNGNVERLLARGAADGVLALPVSSDRVREILQAIAAGTLASLLEARRSDGIAELPQLPELKVLVADDSPVNREVVSEALARLGARTTLVEDGRQALEAFERDRYDIVLMDCSMPEMDGFTATRAIRDLEIGGKRERTPVVALTAHVAGSAADSWRDAGMDDYLSKPFTMRSLSECLARWAPAGSVAPDATISAEASATEAAADSEPPLDPAVLESLRAIAGGNGAMLQRIFGLFQAHAPARLAGLIEACAAGDMERAASEAHALKSPSLNIGAARLGRLCAELEEKARAGDAQVLAAPAHEAIADELAAVMAAIELQLADGNAAPGVRPMAAQ